MREELFGSARRWADAGVAAYRGVGGRVEKDFAVHHAAVALEHLAKAYLCSLHPTLIALPDVDSLLHLAGHGDRAVRPRQAIKTIGLAEASDRVKRVLRSYPQAGNAKDDRLIASRNGIAHAALWDDAEVRAVLALAVRRIDAILAAMGTDRAEFWGAHADLTNRLVDEAVTDAALRAEAKINAARTKFAEQFAGLQADEREAIIPLFAANRRFWTDHHEQHPCPACGNQAWLGGTTETRFDLAGVDTPHGEASRATVVFYPFMLMCSVCGLDLNEDELVHTDVDDMIELPDAEPDIPEPDEDWIREHLAYPHDEP